MSSGLLLPESSEDDILKCTVCTRELVDAVLLDCLHSACRSCTKDDVTGGVTCPVCLVKTDTTIGKTNLLVSSLAHRSLVLKDVFSCTHHAEEDQPHATAVVWCYTCQKSLCVDCHKCHNRLLSSHKVLHLNDRTMLLELYRPIPQVCNKHDEDVKFACFTCKDVRCCKCAHDCYTSSHEVQPIDVPDTLKRINGSITQASAVLSDLNSAVALLQAYLGLPEKVGAAREKSLDMLQKAKKTALDLISNAYDSAAESLLECWDTLVMKSVSLRESAERLKVRVDWTNRYCQQALNSNYVAGLLSQLDAVVYSLKALHEEVRQFKDPVDPLKLIRLNLCLPSDLQSIVSGWFGLAKVITDDFNCSINDFPAEESNDYYARQVASQKEVKKLHDQLKEQQEQLEQERRTVERLQSELKSKTRQLSAATIPLSFNVNPRGTFKGPGRCWDVTVTPQGSLLVAALADGLKEYDAACFREIATWIPDSDLLGEQRSVFVRTVDSLSDGRAVVGLNPKHVVLLRRDAGSSSESGSNPSEVWRVERRIAELQAPPRRLSAWDDRLLAVLEDRYDESKKTWLPGPGLVLFSLHDDGKQLHRRRLDYNALSIALTDRGIIVTSEEEVQLTDVVSSVRVNKKCYLVDCYSLSGESLWRHVVSDNLKTMSVCSDSVGRVIYAAKGGNEVVALSVDDGHQLSTVMKRTTKETDNPYALAFHKPTQKLLALISFDGAAPNNVTIFSVV